MSKSAEKNKAIIDSYVSKYLERHGLNLHPEKEVSGAVIEGLIRHMEELGRPLCPCRFYPDKQEAVAEREWLCPCNDMKKYKYCHCMLFVTETGMPVTEHLPDDHEGRLSYGEVKDPKPESIKK